MAEKFFQGITDFIFVEHSVERADIIFVPGGNYPEAAQHAAALYHQGLAPYILPSGKYSILERVFHGSYETEWEYLRNILLTQGVPDTAILREDKASFTYENAIESRKVTDTMGMEIRRAILSCQAFHARRCLMYYQEQFPEARIMVSPVVTRDISRENWYTDKEKAALILGEVEKCGAQFRSIMNEYVEENYNND